MSSSTIDPIEPKVHFDTQVTYVAWQHTLTLSPAQDVETLL